MNNSENPSSKNPSFSENYTKGDELEKMIKSLDKLDTSDPQKSDLEEIKRVIDKSIESDLARVALLQELTDEVADLILQKCIDYRRNNPENNPYYKTLSNLAANQNLSQDFLIKLFEYDKQEYGVDEAMLSLSSLRRSLNETFGKGGISFFGWTATCESLAINPKTPPIILDRLAKKQGSKSFSGLVRATAIENPNISMDTLRELSKDSDERVAKSAKEALDKRSSTDSSK